MSMPPEICKELFKHLDVTTSVCLGLTCRKMYSIHYEDKGKVDLWFKFSGGEFPQRIIDKKGRQVILIDLITNWMGPQFFYSWEERRFVPIEGKRKYDEAREVKDLKARREMMRERLLAIQLDKIRKLRGRQSEQMRVIEAVRAEAAARAAQGDNTTTRALEAEAFMQLLARTRISTLVNTLKEFVHRTGFRVPTTPTATPDVVVEALKADAVQRGWGVSDRMLGLIDSAWTSFQRWRAG
jgi:hypothetical protein